MYDNLDLTKSKNNRKKRSVYDYDGTICVADASETAHIIYNTRPFVCSVDQEKMRPKRQIPLDPALLEHEHYNGLVFEIDFFIFSPMKKF